MKIVCDMLKNVWSPNLISKFRDLLLFSILLCLLCPLWGISPESYLLPYAWEERFTQTAPPPSPVRPIAEFEPASHVMIRYPLGIPLSLVAQLSNTADLVCLVSGTSQQNSAYDEFSNAGVNMDRLSFMTASTDSYWTRDYAPWFIFDGNGDYAVVDFQYNRPRPGDNMVTEIYANNLGLPYYGMNLKQTGGNYMTDGINTAAQTQIAYTENANNQASVNSLMEDYLGITNYHVVQDPNNTYIDHIDCWGKFLAPDKVLIRSVPQSHEQYDEIEATAAYFAGLNCAWGYPYRVYRVNTPQNQPYTNSLILNKRVFVPQMGSSYDTAALEVYSEAMPGYEIIGVTDNYYAPWESTDALHCRTHEIPDQEMLHIAHNPYHGILDPANEYVFDALVIPYSNSALVSDSLYVAYSVNDGSWQSVPMYQQEGYNYRASISSLMPGDEIRYYISAVDQSGKHRTHPEFAALDPHVFSIYNDNLGPDILHNPILSISEEEITFVATITDESGVATVWMEYCIDDGDTMTLEFVEAGSGVYLGLLAMDFSAGAEYFNYRICAQDIPGKISYLPSEEEYYAVPIETQSAPSEFNTPAAITMKVYPNPLHNGAELRALVKQEQAGPLRMQIFNVKGQLLFERTQAGRELEFRWDGRDNSGKKATSGIYFLRATGTSGSLNRKLIIVY
jgi:agmatine/peptidylarginine deiminase